MGKRILVVIICLGFIFSPGYPVTAADEPASSIEVTIPQYEVEQIDGFDYVDIPGGDVLLVEGKPRVPYYPVSIDYPAGYRVQDVVIAEISGLTTAVGLNLPVVVMETDTTFNGDTTTPPIEQAGWYPEEDFNWEVWSNSDGSSSLVIAVYPFYYNAETTEARFYSTYRFDIEYVYSNVEITAFDTDSYIYTPGEDIAFDLRLANSGEARDVIVNMAVKSYMDDELVYGLPIKSLKDLAGEGAYSDIWDTGGTSPGDYYAEAVITDTYGNILDSETVGFSIRLTDMIETPRETAVTTTLTEPTKTTEKPSDTSEKPSEFPKLYVIIGAALLFVIATTLIIIKFRRKTRP